jgi:hypothetical protein
MPDEDRQNLYNSIAQQLPVRRVAQPEDIAENKGSNSAAFNN